MTNYDKYLDPPNEPTHGNCDRCGAWCDYDDMTLDRIPNIWVCDDCLEEYDQMLLDELENE